MEEKEFHRGSFIEMGNGGEERDGMEMEGEEEEREDEGRGREERGV